MPFTRLFSISEIQNSNIESFEFAYSEFKVEDGTNFFRGDLITMELGMHIIYAPWEPIKRALNPARAKFIHDKK